MMISIVNLDSVDVDKSDYLIKNNYMYGYLVLHIDAPRFLRFIYKE